MAPNINDISIVLTGTIIPNAPFTVISNPAQRRREYLEAIDFYSKFAPVCFLENSSYNLAGDMDFITNERVMIRKFPMSASWEKGKGYQEFEMLDSWIISEFDIPGRWIKITGRYIFRNISSILEDCRRKESKSLIIDLCRFSQKARTHLFCARTDFYRKYLLDTYKNCDDESGDWIERILFKRVESLMPFETSTFSVEPDLKAISGSTGGDLGSSVLKYNAKSILRTFNRLFDKQYLWYTR